MNIIKNNIYWIVLIITTFFSIQSLFHSGLIPTHDGEYHIIRFYEFNKGIKEGILYPRWAPDLNNGYGVPLFNYVYPFPNYVASIIYIFNNSFINAFKLSLIIASFLGSLFSYLWLRRFFGQYPALIGSIFFTYSPYRFVDIYVRGSVGEIWAMSLFMGVLWCTTEYFHTKSKKYFFLSTILFSFTIFSHNIVGLMYFTFFIFYLYIIGVYKQTVINKKIFLIPILSVGITAIFWIPALLEKVYVKGLQIFDINNNFPELYQLIFPSWGTGFAINDLNNQMSFQIGIANLTVIVFSIFLLCKKNEYKKFLYFFLCWFLLILYLILPYSAWIWQKLPLIQYFQFPWRFLSLIIIFTAFIAAYVSRSISWRVGRLFLILIPIIFAIQYTFPAYYLERSDIYYTTRSNFIDGTNSPGNTFNTIWMNSSLQKSKDKVIYEENLDYIVLMSKTNEYKFKIKTNKQQIITMGIAYFPGWKVFVGEKEVKTAYNKDGLLIFSLPQGDNIVRVVFANTLVRTVAQIISIFSFLILLLVLYFKKIL